MGKQAYLTMSATILLFVAMPAGPFSQTAEVPAKDYEAISLLGAKLVPPPADEAALSRLTEARQAFERDPGEDNTIWLGRRLAYAGRYREAIRVFTDGLARFPRSYRLLRHRGHRFITIRQFQRAAEDFDKAAEFVRGRPLEVEPDGIPNKAGKPVSNTQFNIFYHLGLTRFLSGDYNRAAEAYRECLKWSKNDDSVVAVTDWLFLTLKRLGRAGDAVRALTPIKPRMTIIENEAYHQRLLMYKGLVKPEDLLRPQPGQSEAVLRSNSAVREYGLGNRRLWEGDKRGAMDTFQTLVREGNWAAFGTIAAEADLARLLLENPHRATVEETLASWTAFWNAYDLSAAEKLFLTDDRPSYFSSEKKGLIRGFNALLEHHKGFGFVPGGKAQDNRLWLEDVYIQAFGPTANVAARWLFDKNVGTEGPVQHGPVTFQLIKGDDGWRIAHAHFANW